MSKPALIKLRLLRLNLFNPIGWHPKQRYAFDYQPELGCRSEKAERLVDYCLGEFRDKPIPKCTKNLNYLTDKSILLFETKPKRVEITAGRRGATHNGKRVIDQKKVVEALISQRADITPGLCCWLIRSDNFGRTSNPEQGLHIAGMRSKTRRDLVLVPTANRNRFLGPNLKRQMQELRRSWTPWEEKSDSAWWGGALSGRFWKDREPRTLTRAEVLCYFRDHPSDKVSLQTTQAENLPSGIKLFDRFTKQSAFQHKCLILLPGNDIASGSSWYFAGNSVVLMPTPHLEHILYFEMQPWVHYVPLENDPADILVKLQWVLDNQEEAKNIVENSHKRLRWLCGKEYLWACNEVFRRISQN